MFRQWACCSAADDDDVRTEGKSCVKANVHVSTEFLSVRRTRRGMRATVYRRLCLQSAATFCRQHLDSDGATTNFKRTRSFLTYFRRQICRRKSVECRPIYAQQRSWNLVYASSYARRSRPINGHLSTRPATMSHFILLYFAPARGDCDECACVSLSVCAFVRISQDDVTSYRVAFSVRSSFTRAISAISRRSVKLGKVATQPHDFTAVRANTSPGNCHRCRRVVPIEGPRSSRKDGTVPRDRQPAGRPPWNSIWRHSGASAAPPAGSFSFLRASLGSLSIYLMSIQS